MHGGAAERARVELRWIEAEDLDRAARSTGSAISTASGAGRLRRARIEGRSPRLSTRAARIRTSASASACGRDDRVRAPRRWGEGSSEFDAQATHKVIDLMADQSGITQEAADALGSYRCALREGSLAARAYGRSEVEERHRHRYEFNNKYAAQLQSRGLVLSGKCVGRELVEIIELPDHPWFLAVQFHPELKSRPHDPHPLFVDFVRAALERRRARLGTNAFDAGASSPAGEGMKVEHEGPSLA